MARTHSTSPLLEALAERVLVFDGAMGTQIQEAGLAPGDFTLDKARLSGLAASAAERLGGRPLDGCTEALNLTRPDVVESIHSHYLEAGADLIETNSFGATSIVLGEYDVPELVREISLAAARIARSAADRYSTTAKPRFVVGGLGPGTKLLSLQQTTWDAVVATYQDAATALIEGGVDALLLETMQDLLLLKAAIVASNRAMAESERRLPLIVQVTMEQTGTMLLGSEIGAALNMLEAFPSVTAVGLNCATGPKEMAPHVRFLGQNSTRPISVQPNAGLPTLEDGRTVYKLAPEEFVRFHEHFVNDFGVAMAGGCCGTTPAHSRLLAEAVGGRPHNADSHWRRVRHLFPGFDFKPTTDDQAGAQSLVGCSSLYQFMPYEQENSFLIVGERTNANGSKAFRDMLAREDWETLTELAREQEAEGSQVLDVCVAYVGRDESSDAAELLGRYNRQVTVPIMVDSTEAPVIEQALQRLAGKPIVNSINFEDGGARLHRVLGLCTEYGAAVVALTIDEEGMAKTKERKVAIAERILAETRRYGLPDHDVFMDCLTFTLGSGDEEFRTAAVETLEAIGELKRRHPRLNTILGVSNISFGLKMAARTVLNSAFLHYALEAGLSSAIVHYSKIRPESQIDPETWQIAGDLVFDRRRYEVAGT